MEAHHTPAGATVRRDCVASVERRTDLRFARSPRAAPTLFSPRLLFCRFACTTIELKDWTT
jgi:hypothetical protein